MVDQQSTHDGLRELALFAGAGGGLLASRMLGWRTVCAVEWDDYARNALVARQNDGSLEAFPIWSDVQTFDGRPWRGIVDVISGGFPCQDISAAGKGAGIDGERSGMWGHMARIISEVRPGSVFVENSPMLTSRGLGRVLGDLAEMGFDAKWGVMGALRLGALHQRERIWIAANTKKIGRFPIAYEDGQFQKARGENARLRDEQFGRIIEQSISEEAHAEIKRDGDVMARWVGRLGAIGNGQVPQVASRAFKILSESW